MALEDFCEVMAAMRRDGASLESVVRTLIDKGATEIDLIRVVKRVEDVGVRRAAELIYATGVVPPKDTQLTITIPEGHSLEEYFSSSEREEMPPRSSGEPDQPCGGREGG